MTKSLKDRFQSNFLELGYWSSDMPTILVALSGGADSVALASLLVEIDVPIALAHVNFGLRGEESEQDNVFCRNLAEGLKVDFYETRANINTKTAIQESARDFRYNWFEKVRSENSYSFIATGHHKNDQVETMLLNFIRGSGINGLQGIPEKRSYVIRPLLPFSKDELITYLKERKISFRDDQSNYSDRYSRNTLRNRVIPLAKEINPSLDNTLADRARDYSEINYLYQLSLEAETRKLVSEHKYGLSISLTGIQKHPAGRTILFESLHRFGFDRKQVAEIWDSLPGRVGSHFYSKDYLIWVQRKDLVITPINLQTEEKILVTDFGSYQTGSGVLKVDRIPASKIPGKESRVKLFLPLDEYSFPFCLRNWEKGDFFYPEGMKKESGAPMKKKISDYLTDTKQEPIEKQNQKLLEHGDQCLWLIGKRKDARLPKKRASDVSFIRFTWKPD